MSGRAWDNVDFGQIAEEHDEIKGRSEIRAEIARWVYKQRRPRLDLDAIAAIIDLGAIIDLEFHHKPMTLAEIEAFFHEHPGRKKPIHIDADTPLSTVAHYLATHSQIADLTEILPSSARPIPPAAARTALSHVYCIMISDERQVAVKCLRQHDNKEVKRTARELHVWSKMKHRNILALDGLAIFQNCLAMVSPWMAYGSVCEVLRKWPDIKRFPLCLQLAQAITYLHGENVVHGDIKGANLLVDGDGTLKLTDSGLAIMHDKVLEFSQTDPGGGTLRWMAPELHQENAQRSREADIYAMGMTMLEIITGEIPFKEIAQGYRLVTEVVDKRRVPQVPILEGDKNSPKATTMLGVLRWCWSYEPSARPTAGQVALVVEGITPE